LDEHQKTARILAGTLPLLFITFCVEAVEVLFRGNLAVSAQFFDIASDLFAVLFAMIAAIFSWVADSKGREHKKIHREQKFVAIINMLLLLFGILIVGGRVLQSLQNPPESDQNILVLGGPICAIVCYSWAQRKAKQLDQNDPSIASVRAHLRGDIWVSFVICIIVGLGFVLDYKWINPAGGVVGLLILLYILIDLARHFTKNDH